MLINRKNNRAFVYSFFISLGVVALQQIALTSGNNAFLLGFIVVSLLLALELYTTRRLASTKLSQFDLITAANNSNSNIIVYHTILPSILLVSLAGFIYFNNQPGLWPIYFLTSFILYSMLFINIRAHYEDKFKLEEETEIVYDLIKIFSFFAITNLIINLSSLFDFNYFIITGLLFIVSSLLSLLVIAKRKNLHFYYVPLILLASLFLAYITSAIITIFEPTVMVTSFYATIIFYLINALLHHELEKTLRIGIVIEYILTALIAILILIIVP